MKRRGRPRGRTHRRDGLPSQPSSPAPSRHRLSAGVVGGCQSAIVAGLRKERRAHQYPDRYGLRPRGPHGDTDCGVRTRPPTELGPPEPGDPGGLVAVALATATSITPARRRAGCRMPNTASLDPAGSLARWTSRNSTSGPLANRTSDRGARENASAVRGPRRHLDVGQPFVRPVIAAPGHSWLACCTSRTVIRPSAPVPSMPRSLRGMAFSWVSGRGRALCLQARPLRGSFPEEPKIT